MSGARAANTALRAAVDDILRQSMRDGTLERIFRHWQVWNDDQPALFARVLAGAPIEPVTGDGSADLRRRRLGVGGDDTLSAVARSGGGRHNSAVMSGDGAGRPPGLRDCQRARVRRPSGPGASRRDTWELVRGTPLLLQLFVLYYGLAEAVRLPAFLAALLGLALNYAAYESEIYRGALEAVPAGQLEAGRALGLTELQVLRLVRGPQAFRLALAPMTNDFVALLKDSSLVSVLTVVELTKQTQIFATNVGSWVVPGALCAALYLLMSIPLASLARRLERRWKAPAS